MNQGVVHTSLRLRSRIYNKSLGERLLFRAWNFPRSKQASLQQRRLLISEVIWFHESESKYTPVPGRRYAPAKILGGLNWCPSIHHPSTTEKISISLRPGLGLRSPIVERNYCLILTTIVHVYTRQILKHPSRCNMQTKPVLVSCDNRLSGLLKIICPK